MNQHLKLAYDHGVQKALEDAGLTKTAEGFGAETTPHDLFNDPASRSGDRTVKGLGGLGLGAAGGALGGAALALLLKQPHAIPALRSAGGLLGGGYGLYKGTEASMEDDPLLMRLARGTSRGVGLT